jgi:hypothetical protein
VFRTVQYSLEQCLNRSKLTGPQAFISASAHEAHDLAQAHASEFALEEAAGPVRSFPRSSRPATASSIALRRATAVQFS